MTVAVCLDNKNGMLFNKRRQSRDKLLIADFINRAGNNKVYISEYSKSIFSDYSISVTEDILNIASQSDFYFLEQEDISLFANKIDRLLIYRWNRDYPADTYFNFDLSGYAKTEEVEFKGFSHEKITCEVYLKNEE